MGNSFDYVKVNLASPTRIRSWGTRQLPNGQIVGEIQNQDTLDYKTLKPSPGGLFCETIFGPVRSTERRYRTGLIELNSPVVHIWYLKGRRSKLATVLGRRKKDVVEEIVLYGAYKIQAELEEMDLKEISVGLRNGIPSTLKPDDGDDHKRTIVRIRLLEQFIASDSHPSWMVLTVIPVLPPDLRPLLQTEEGLLVSHDLNDLYRRVINRNKRLRDLRDISVPIIVIRNEERMLQEAVDALLDNGRLTSPVVGSNKQPLKSLSKIIEGKEGRFRRNLLGKRVDYSGRSVIVAGPELGLGQCGVPFEMVVTLFEPFILHRLVYCHVAPTYRAARKLLQGYEGLIWPLVQDVIRGHPVLLNRAPTLHRLGIQAFEPILIRGKAIKLHPLVCSGFNADFDGDQMAIHIPLSLESQLEARLLMLSSRHFLSPGSLGKVNLCPSQDVVLGCYYMTIAFSAQQSDKTYYFSSFNDVITAYHQGKLSLHNFLWVKCNDLEGQIREGRETQIGDSKYSISPYKKIKKTHDGEVVSIYIRTTPGRILLNQAFQ